jgi:hypothetical protein
MAHLNLSSIFIIVMRDLRNTAMATPIENAGEEFSSAEIRDALERVRHSHTIAGSEKLIQFLSFVVETTLSGNARHLKETIIGISVFGRAPDYDPKADTIVRSQAWRLRSKLNEYYQSEGASDPVLIELPRGSYVPLFVRRSHDPAKTPSVLPCEPVR